MAEMLHTVYKGPEGETTQWDDIQRKLGNLAPKAPVWKPEKYTPEAAEVKDKAWVADQDAECLSDLEDEFTDDRFLEGYRQRRIQELKHAVRRPRFGTVEEIRAAEFIQKVTQASCGANGSSSAIGGDSVADNSATSSSDHTQMGGKSAGVDREGGCSAWAAQGQSSDVAGAGNQGPGSEPIWVVVQLYKDGHGPSALMSSCIDELATRYPSTKFTRIVSTDCIPKYPDANLPTLLVYHQGACVRHLVGLSMFGGSRTTPEQVALVLNGLGPVCNSARDLEDEDDSGAAGSEDVRLVKKMLQRVVAAREDGDEDSDFED